MTGRSGISRPRPLRRRLALAAGLAGLACLLLASGTTAFPGREKVLSPGLPDRFKTGSDRIEVIILLRGVEELTGLDLRAEKGLAASVRAGVAKTQDSVLDRLDPASVRVRHRLENLPVLAASVTAEGLRRLTALEEVAAVEEDRPIAPFTVQGLRLIASPLFREQSGGQGLAIAVVDTGIDYSHPALGDGGFPNDKVIGGYDFADHDSDPRDLNGHGTSCAALAAGENTDSGDYVGGVAPQAKIYALKVFTDSGQGLLSNIAAAWDWCLTHRNDRPSQPIKVISTALGVTGSYYESFCDSSGQLLTSLSALARSCQASGLAIFAPSGNQGYCRGLAAPACLSQVIAVGAVYDANVGQIRSCLSARSCLGESSPGCAASLGESGARFHSESSRADQVAAYSNSGPRLDLLAPADCARVPTAGNSYEDCFTGTSAACAYAVGAAAVIQAWAKAENGQFLTVNQLKTRLVNNGEQIRDSKSGLSRPRINIRRAIQALSTTSSEE